MAPVSFIKFTNNTSSTFAFTTGTIFHTCLVFVGVSGSSSSITAVVYNGVDNFTILRNDLLADTISYLAVMLNPTQTSGNIVSTGGGANDHYGILQYNNVLKVGADNGTTTTGDTISTTASGFVSGDMTAGVGNHRVNEAGTHGGTTERLDGNAGSIWRIVVGESNSSGNQQWTFATSARGVISVVNLKQFETPPGGTWWWFDKLKKNWEDRGGILRPDRKLSIPPKRVYLPSKELLRI